MRSLPNSSAGPHGRRAAPLRSWGSARHPLSPRFSIGPSTRWYALVGGGQRRSWGLPAPSDLTDLVERVQMATGLPKPCIVCGVLVRGGAARCAVHAAQQKAAKDARRAARMASGDGAAARVRRAINRAGVASCQVCGGGFLASALRVDHRLALVDGGADTDGNVQVLCTPCHADKTASEARARARTQHRCWP